MTQSGCIGWKVELLFPKGCDLEDGLRRISQCLGDLDTFFDTIPGLDAGGRADMRLVCDEIGSNVVRHSTREKATCLQIEVETVDEALHLRIRDNGCEFNPFTHAQPYLGSDLDKRGVGGLGLYLIKRLFPVTSYQRVNGWNISEVSYAMDRDTDKKIERSAAGVPKSSPNP